MTDILINEKDNTFIIAKDGLTLTRTNLEYVKQKTRVALSFQKGEYFTDAFIGLPFIPDFDQNKSEHRSILTSAIQARIMQIEEIKKLLSFNSYYNEKERKLYVSFVAQTTFGEELEYNAKINIGG